MRERLLNPTAASFPQHWIRFIPSPEMGFKYCHRKGSFLCNETTKQLLLVLLFKKARQLFFGLKIYHFHSIPWIFMKQIIPITMWYDEKVISIELKYLATIRWLPSAEVSVNPSFASISCRSPERCVTAVDCKRNRTFVTYDLQTCKIMLSYVNAIFFLGTQTLKFINFL